MAKKRASPSQSKVIEIQSDLKKHKKKANVNDKWVDQKLQYFQTVDDFKLEEEVPTTKSPTEDAPIVVSKANRISHIKISVTPDIVAEYEAYKRALGELEPHSIEEFVVERSSSFVEGIVE